MSKDFIVLRVIFTSRKDTAIVNKKCFENWNNTYVRQFCDHPK